MRALRILAAILYFAIFVSALGTIPQGGEALGWAFCGLLVPPIAVLMARRQDDRHWQAVTIGTGLFVGAFLVLNALSV